MNQIKLKRIASQIIKEVSEILANESSDSLLKTITITGCDVANDLAVAKIYFTSLTALDKKTLEKELDEAAGYIRKELANRIELRHTPQLRFSYDASIEYGEKIEKIIEELNKE